MDTRNEIKSYIVHEGMTMAELVEKLAEQYGWSASVPIFVFSVTARSGDRFTFLAPLPGRSSPITIFYFWRRQLKKGEPGGKLEVHQDGCNNPNKPEVQDGLYAECEDNASHRKNFGHRR